MSQTAETLRALAKEMEPLQDTYECEVVACEAGARAWEIVQKLIERSPWDNVTCTFCGAWDDERQTHEPDCLWQQARSLLDAEGR